MKITENYETKFTPGPWIAAQRYSSKVGLPVVSSTYRRSIASVTFFGLGEQFKSHDDESYANANLIAAAPELLLALEALLEAYSKPDVCLCCDGRDCGCMGSTNHQQAEHYARVAISKARGATHPSGGDHHGE